MKIVQVATEFAPLIKVGGLGDAVYGLSKALAPDHDVEVILPFYPTILPQFSTLIDEKSFSYEYLGKQHASATSYIYEGMTITLIKLISQSDLFSTSSVYTENDALRFGSFSSAVANYIQSLSHVDIVHMHDWHTGLLAGLLKEPNLPHYPKRIFTIHNFAYRGYCDTQLLAVSGISHHGLSNYQLFRDSQVSMMLKGAIYCSDYITTVSPSYAQDILHDDSDKELYDAMQAKQHNFCGILNGIDESTWDPETDSALVANYSHRLLDSPDLLMMRKKENKFAIYHRLNMASDDIPLMCIISRIVEQKGPELMKETLLHAMENHYALVILGSCFDPETQRQFSNLRNSLDQTPHIRIILDFDPELSRLLYAGSDMICIPSIFEPCGLTQLIGMRYGTVPIVRSTGGLADTITPNVNGFCFSEMKDFSQLRQALSAAVTTYYNEPDTWHQLIKQGMLRQSGLEVMAKQYLQIYSSR